VPGPEFTSAALSGEDRSALNQRRMAKRSSSRCLGAHPRPCDPSVASIELPVGLLRSVPFGIEPGSPFAVTVAVLALAAVAVVSTAAPALRGSRIDPAIAIRYERSSYPYRSP